MMRTRHTGLIFAGAVALVFVLAIFAHGAFTQRTTFDGKNVILNSDYQLTGSHADDLVVMGTNLSLDTGSSVDGDASLIGDNIRVAGQVSGDLTALGKTLTLDQNADVQGDAHLMGTNVTIAGHVEGDLIVNGETLTIMRGAQIDGDINCVGTIQDQRPGVTPVTCGSVNMAPFAPLLALRSAETGNILLLLFAVVGTLALMGVSVLSVTFFPVQISHIEEAMRARPRHFGGVGIAAYALTLGIFVGLIVVLAIFPPLGLLLIPLGLILLLLLLLFSLTGLVTLALMLGDLLLHRFSKAPLPPLIAAVSGSLIFSLILAGVAFLPFGLPFSFLLLGLCNSVGLGAALFTRVGTRPASRTYFIQG